MAKRKDTRRSRSFSIPHEEIRQHTTGVPRNVFAMKRQDINQTNGFCERLFSSVMSVC